VTTFEPLPFRIPVTNRGLVVESFDYFGVALARRHNKNQYVDACWYVVHIVVPAGYMVLTPWTNLPVPMALSIMDRMIRSRFRHPSGRLYYHEEGVLVVNELNHRYKLAKIAAMYQIGGLSKLVRMASIDVLNLETSTIEE
jgi:hypothetical protein